MNVLYYFDARPPLPTRVQSELFSSEPSFSDSAAVERRRWVRLAADSSVAFPPAPMPQSSSLVGGVMASQVTSFRAPVLPLVHRSPLWPARLHRATLCNSTQMQYLVRTC